MRACILMMLLALPSAAQDNSPGPPKVDPKVQPDAGKPTIDPNNAPAPAPRPAALHRVTLKSGTILVGSIAPDEWTVTTDFGKLRVPLTDIVRVDFGRGADPALVRKVDGWIAELADPDPADRKRAMRMLRLEAAFALRSIEAAAKSHDDPAVKKACEELAAAIDLDEEEVVGEHDVIVTKAFTFRGSVEPQSFQVRVAELGGLNVRRRDIRSIVATKMGDLPQKKIEVTGSDNHRKWLPTKIKLKKGQRFRVKATGSIHFTQWGNNGVCSPQHGGRFGSTHNYPIGVLLGRIGNGRWFHVGADYRGKASADGVLMFAVNHNYHSNIQHTGAYEVVVTTR